MPPSEDADPPAGRKRPVRRGIAIPPVGWIVVVGGVLLVTGSLIAQLSPYSSDIWSWHKLGDLLGGLGLFVFIAIPGALVALGHPWAAVMPAQELNHPRLFGLTHLWAGILLLGWILLSWTGAVALLFPYTPVPVKIAAPYVVLLVGFAPMFAILIFDRR